MRSALELHDSRVSHIELVDSVATIYFSHAHIHKSRGTPGRDPGTGWSQELRLMMWSARASGQLPTRSSTVAEGFLEVGGIRHELIPLPFRRKVGARLYLLFVDGVEADIVGDKPLIDLLGTPIYLEEFG
jgi:hypothetical protein